MAKERRLGKGLDALIGSEQEAPALTVPMASAGAAREVGIDLLRPNRYQPRTEFDEASLDELAKSLGAEGILQPILVRKQGEFYEIIAGERRWRAAQKKGLKTIPVVVKDVDDRKALELALIENIHRRDLTPIEKARAFKELLKHMGSTQEEVAEQLGLDRSTLANFLRLLELPHEIQECVSRGTISMGHARALISVPNQVQQIALLRRIIQEDLSVRAIERLVTTYIRRDRKKFDRPERDPYFKDLEDRLTSHFGSKVTVQPKGKGGFITIEYYSPDQFNGILRKLGVDLS